MVRLPVSGAVGECQADVIERTMAVTRSIRTPALLLAVLALVVAGLVLPAQAASSKGAVKGVVTLDGKPVKGVRVELYWIGADTFSGPRLGVDTTNSKGAYSFSGFPVTDRNDSDLSGKAVVVKDPAGRIVSTSRELRDRAGRTVTRNVSVKRAGSITGVVRRGDGVATARLRTQVFGPDVQIDPDYDSDVVYDTDVDVARDGTFTLRGLPAGDYYLQFVDEGRTYFSQCYDNLPVTAAECDGTFNTSGRPSATPIPVTAGQDVVLNPQTMSTRGRRISGTVTDTSGRPVRDVRVRATVDGRPRPAAETTRSGAFTLGPLTNGSYRLEAVPGSPWAPQADDTVRVVDFQDVTGVRIEVKSLARVRTSVTPGRGTATVAVDVTRLASGGKPSGRVTIRWGTTSRTVGVVKGRAKATLSGLPRGRRTITVAYAGTSSTAARTTTVRTLVK
jgi:hypothetical protein